MYNYQENIEELVTTVGIPNNEIFDYEFAELKNTFDEYFQFCQENLQTRCSKYGIEPARFYYRSEFGINACAFEKNGFSIVGVNMSTIQLLHGLFSKGENLFSEDGDLREKFGEIIGRFDVPAEYLMYQMSTLFIYYHERAHLIQRSPGESLFINEKYLIGSNEFSLESHILEFDADLHGAHNVTFHLLHYFKKLSDENRTSSNLEKILSIGISSIFSYFMLYFEQAKDVYYFEGSHPHPLVRISYIIDTVIKTSEGNLPENLELNSSTVFRDALTISKSFLKANFSGEIFDDFISAFLNEKDEIESYVNSLIHDSQGKEYLLRNRHLD